MIFDTDVLIWYQRGHGGATQAIRSAERRTLSCQTFMELLQGARSQNELRVIKHSLNELGFIVLPLTENIGHRAMVYIEQSSLASGLRAGDALIAATAVENDLPLVTANVKHFRRITDLRLTPFRP